MTSSDLSLKPAFSALDSAEKSHIKQWLLIALISIALSGVAPLLLLAGRASFMAEMTAIKQWFVPVLVIHVNLSVGLWFIALAFMLCRILWPVRLPLMLHEASVWSFLFGVVAMVCAPFAGGKAFTSNYIPVQNNALFFFGLALVFAATLCQLMPPLWQMLRRALPSSGAVKACCIWLSLLSALGCFALSIMQHPDGYGGEAYYEAIFWGGGHILQLVYVQIAMVAWLWLGKTIELKLPSQNGVNAAFILLALTALTSPIIYLLVDINSYYHIKFFSWQMNVVTGTIPGLLAFWLIVALRNSFQRGASFWVLLSSLILFLSGGLVGFLIEGSNTIIPAHYHGSTVGVTLALMGVAYIILPLIKGQDVQAWKMAKWQPVLYGAGQLLHVIGFAIAGSEGVARKAAGSMEGASELAQFGMQLVRFGGILAVIGGGLFVVVMWRAWPRRRAVVGTS